MKCRVLKSGECEISSNYRGGNHKAVDLVGKGYTLDSIVAHSAGTVVGIVDNVNYNTSKTGQKIYGNYVKIKHDNGMYTLYAHIKYGTIAVKMNQRVDKGTVLGYMGNTGYSFGAHLHFEVRDKNNKQIDPTPYINSGLQIENNNYKVGNVYTIQVSIKVRTGPGVNYEWKDRKDITNDGKKYSLEQEKATLLPNTRVTLLELKEENGNIWGKIPSGWIAFVYDGKVYVK